MPPPDGLLSAQELAGFPKPVCVTCFSCIMFPGWTLHMMWVTAGPPPQPRETLSTFHFNIW